MNNMLKWGGGRKLVETEKDQGGLISFRGVLVIGPEKPRVVFNFTVLSDSPIKTRSYQACLLNYLEATHLFHPDDISSWHVSR